MWWKVVERKLKAVEIKHMAVRKEQEQNLVKKVSKGKSWKIMQKRQSLVCLKIVPDDEKAINIKPLARKSPIVDWKIQMLAEDISYYQIIKDERSLIFYKVFSTMLNDFDRQDLLDMHRLEEGIDYEEVFSPVERIEAIKLFLAYASFMGFMVYQIDVKNAFLYETIKEEVYACQPPGFKDPDYPDKVYKVVKALYGLHQAPRAWYETLANYLLNNGFQRGKIDQTLFIKKKKASTPIDTEKPLLKDPDGKGVDVHTCRSMIGSLMYLTSSRPDIMFAVCACARFQVTPKASHLHAVKRIFRYLKGKPHLGLWYPKDSPFYLVAYLDSDYAGASLDRKSTTGGCQFLSCRLISWQCKKQTVVATSSTEAEYVVTASCCAQVLSIQNQLLDYGIDCLPNEEIFTELARMGYEKPSRKLTFYKVFFSTQWKFLVHIILQCMSAKKTAWNEFSSSIASANICLTTGGCIQTRGIIAEIDADKDVTLEEVDAEKDAEVAKKNDDVQGRLEEPQAQVYHLESKHVDKVLSMHDDEAEPAELTEVIEVVTTAKLLTEVVIATATTITAAPSAARRRKDVVIRDPEETTTLSIIVHFEPKSKDKRKGYGMSYNDIRPIFEKHFNSIVGFLEKSENELEEEASKALKRKSKSSEQQAAKKQKLDEKVEELKTHLEIIPNDEDDVYTEATPLALKVSIVDYQIHIENNKPYYKIIRADGTHQLFLSFIGLLRNFNKEDLEMLWQIVQERFTSLKPKNFSDDFFLTTLKTMFEKPVVEA
uniref:Putative reverse transcriptase, RNA-dependent DNA polymerase n=1 Tax=Tanacetum cinerariifolium TaxID=118510 RepID=A0A699H810_TANCI|nr:putative reverse transcriptase, RNA-dependent DNA polymerase [Tanacetum cinerariifolium]